MKVTFKTGSEANYGSTNGELFFASNTKQIMLNGIKYIPKKLSELTNDSGFISSITKSMVEGVLTGNITSHTHSYLPLTGGTMSNTNIVYKLNADLLDGYHASSFLTAISSSTIDLNEISTPSIYRLDTKNPNLPSNIFRYSNILTIKTTVDTAWQLIGSYSSDALWFRRGTWYADGTGTLRTNAWKVIAFTDSNVASSSKWSTPRTITLTGSVTGSVSIDGSANVSLDTTTNHTHSEYLSLTGGTLTGNLTCNGSYITMSGSSGAKGYSGYFNNPKRDNRANYSHILGDGYAYGTNSISIGTAAYAGIRNTDSDSGTYPYLHWQWMDCLQVKEVTSAGDVNCYGAILNNLGGAKDTAKFTVCVDGVCKFYDESKGEDDPTNQFLKFTNTDASYGRVVVFIANTDTLIFGGNTSHPRRTCNLKIGNMILGQGCYVKNIASMTINGKTVYRLAIYWWDNKLSASYDITKATTAMVCTKVNNSNYDGASSYASGSYSVASGYSSVASGSYSVASGYASVASGYSSVASGNYSVASGNYSVASGNSSVASGYSSVASGNYSVASGYESKASNTYSFVAGYRCSSGTPWQTVIGRTNKPTSDAFVIGNGSGDNVSADNAVQSNCFVVDWNGNVNTTGAITATSFNGSLNGTATNASKLSSHSISELTYASIFTYTSNHGILVQTDFNASSDAHVCAHIWGSGYNSLKPINTYIQFLNYNKINEIINYACFHYGLDLGNVYAFSYNGNLCFWFDISKWIYQTIYVFVGTNSGDVINHVTSLSNVLKPTDGVTREVAITPKLNAFIDSNVASATKFATARTIKVGSAFKSFDGSGDIEFTLNSIITQSDTINVGTLNVAGDAKITGALTVSGDISGDISGELTNKLSITIGSTTTTYDNTGNKSINITPSAIGALENKFIVTKNSYQRYVILLCKTGTNTTNTGHTINGTFYTHQGGAQRYQAAYVNIHSTDWSVSHNEYYGFTPFGIGSKCRLVTCTYQDAQYLAITFENTPETKIYFDGSSINILFTPILYYTENTQTINNPEIYNSIADVVYNKTSIITSLETALTSSNFNSYSPKLDGTGATGTWGINISGNAYYATSAGVASEAKSVENPLNITLGTSTTQTSYNGSAKVELEITPSAIGAAAASHTHTFADITGKPTTLGGYGITDAYTKTETNTELGKYLPLTGGTLNGALTLPKLTSTGGIVLGDSSLSTMVGSVGIQRYDETGFIGFLKDFNLGNSFNGVVLGWDGNYSLSTNSVRIDASTFTYKGNSILHSGNLGYTSSGLSRAVQKDANGNLFIVAPSLFEQGISNNYPKNLRWSNETEGQLVYDTEIEAGNFDTVEIGIPLSDGTSKGFLKSTSTVTNVTGYTPCPVVSGTPYYKEDCLYLGSTEIGYTGIMEYGIQHTYNYGTNHSYLNDYTPDSIPRCVVLCFPDRSSNYRFLFWLSAFDEGDPYIARFYNSAYETWLTIDTASRQIILSYGNTWQS